MRVASLLLHDVVPSNRFADSGFPGADANAYKLFISEFEEHLRAIQARTTGKAAIVEDVLCGRTSRKDFLLTFDDGGVSAIDHVHGLLAPLRWVGHFFIATDYVGKPGFLSRSQIAALARLGHVIGAIRARTRL